jgi:hypothetical protein
MRGISWLAENRLTLLHGVSKYIVYTELTNVAAGRITEPRVGPRLEMHGLDQSFPKTFFFCSRIPFGSQI